jgi:hypothetical protein
LPNVLQSVNWVRLKALSQRDDRAIVGKIDYYLNRSSKCLLSFYARTQRYTRRSATGAEAFNAFNHENFINPNLTLTSPLTFG